MIERLRALQLPAGFWAGIGGWALLVLIALFGGHGCTPARVQERLQTDTETALSEGDIGFVSVRMKGQIAALEGMAPSEAERRRASELALAAAGPGGAWLGGVTQVDASGLRVAAPVSPFHWRASREGRGVRLTGAVPSLGMQASLKREAVRLFGAEAGVEDQTKPSAGAPAAGWVDVAAAGLAALARLQSGEARLTDAHLVVMGRGGREAEDAARAQLRAAVRAPFSFELDVRATGDALAGDGADPAACALELERLTAATIINFAVDDATLPAGAGTALDEVAAAARWCDRFLITVAGHTSAEGDRDLNMRLSQDRAEAVRAYLVSRGVAPDRINAKGFGPDRPRASNATPIGRAANRRIEFELGA